MSTETDIRTALALIAERFADRADDVLAMLVMHTLLDALAAPGADGFAAALNFRLAEIDAGPGEMWQVGRMPRSALMRASD